MSPDGGALVVRRMDASTPGRTLARMNRVGPLLCPILVGRDDLLELADRRLDEVATGQGRFLLLSGEAGVGKSRLLGAIRRKAAGCGFRVAQGDLAPQDRYVPESLVLDLARTMRRLPEFGSLGAAILGLRVDRGGDGLGARRILVLDIVEQLTSALDVPTLLVFEDLQWADELSLEVLADLARAVRDRPVMLVGAYRTDELPAGSILREWKARLIGQRLVEEARLAPLTFDQTALVTTLILATGLPAPRAVVSAVYERTDGIPLHIEELLGALGEDARRDDRAIRDADVPDTIEDAILARVGRLSDDAREVARAGAVIGRCFVPSVLAWIMDRPVAALDEPLEELMRESVLNPLGSDGLFDFRHQLLRDALYGSVPMPELRRLHARAAEFGAALEGASEIHASLHFERAGLRPQAYRAALRGAQAAAAISSRGEAFELYRRAIANVPDDLPAAELGTLYDAYAEAAAAVDEDEIADGAARTARRHHLAADRPIEAARALAALAASARREARPLAERFALVAQGLAELDPLPTTTERDRARRDLLDIRALVECDSMRLDAARTTFAEARRLAAATEDTGDAVDADWLRGWLEVLAGRPGPGLALSLDAARRARDADLESTGVTAYRDAAVLAVRLMDYPAAQVGLHEGLRYADAIQQSHCRHVMAATSALVDWAAGRWDDAVRVAEQELAERGCRRGGMGARDALGFVAVGRGELDQARLLLDVSLEAGRDAGEIALILPALWGLAETDLAAGAPEAAVVRCLDALELASATGERALLIPFVVTGVRAALAARRPEDAERWAEAAGRHLAEWEPIAGPALAHAEGLLRLAAGATVAARGALETAVRGWDARGRTWEAAWARLDLAACLLRGNRPAEALPLLAEVRETGDRLQSPPLQGRAAELAGLARRRGAESEPWRPLTAREFQVARLVAEGMTNADIAGALGLSPRTVGAHIEHILAKLGAMRRAEIAAWATAIRPPGAEAAARR